MDFMTVGTLNSYTKTLSMQTRWNLKKQSGDVNAHTTSLRDMLAKTPAASVAQAQIDEARENDDDRLEKIMNKVYAGKKLTEQEKQYLQTKEPAICAQIEAAEQDEKAYEQELKRCRTKEEVQRARMTHLSASLTRVREVMNNPRIPEEKKLTIIAVQKGHCEKLDASTKAFVKKGEYAKLPTDAEKVRAEKEERETRDEERGVRKPDSGTWEDHSETVERASDESTGTKSAGTGTDGAKREVRVRDTRPKTETESPEARKVRRAKRRAGFAAYIASTDIPESEPLFQAEA